MQALLAEHDTPNDLIREEYITYQGVLQTTTFQKSYDYASSPVRGLDTISCCIT